jgi:hypothetical protein
MSPNQTTPDGFRNGRYWNTLDDNLRTFYLVGYFEGFGKALREFLTPTTKERVLAIEASNVPGVGHGEILTAVSRFYAEPENLNIPIWRAIRVVTLKSAGRPAREVEAEMSKARAIMRTDWGNCQRKNVGCEHLR